MADAANTLRADDKTALDHIETLNKDEKDRDEIQLLDDAELAEDEEMSMTVKEAFIVYPMAMFWTLAMTMCFVMAAYDQSTFGSIIGLPAFREKYGHYGGEKKGYQLTAAWQTGLSKAAGTGSFVGIFINAWAQTNYGYRRTIQVALVWLTGTIFITFYSVNIQMLWVGEFLSGFVFGAFTTSSIGYASEIAPVAIRGFMTSYIALVNSFGQLLAAGVFRGMANLSGKWSYKIPFAVQWVWVLPLFLIATCAPESPWFLVRQGRLEDAEKSLRRLGRSKDGRDPKRIIAMMIRTNEEEKKANSAKQTYLECFQKENLRRTEIACMTMCIIPLCGDWFGGGGSYVFERAGMDTADAFSLNMGLWALACLGTVGSWFILPHVGRRKLMMSGLTVLATLLFLVGILTVPSDRGNKAAKWVQAILILIWIFVFNLTVAPLVYIIVSECSSTRLRSKTIAISRNSYILMALPVAFIASYSLNPTAWNWGTYAGLFWAGTCLLCPLWAYFRLPETKGRTFRELDVLFHHGVSARKFRYTAVEGDEIRDSAAIVRAGI